MTVFGFASAQFFPFILQKQCGVGAAAGLSEAGRISSPQPSHTPGQILPLLVTFACMTWDTYICVLYKWTTVAA